MARQVVDPNDLYTQRELQAIADEQRVIFNSKRERDDTYAAHPGRVLWTWTGVSHGYVNRGPFTWPVGPQRSELFDYRAAGTSFTYAGQTFTFGRNIRVSNRGMRIQVTPDLEDHLAIPLSTRFEFHNLTNPEVPVEALSLADGVEFGAGNNAWDIIWNRTRTPVNLDYRAQYRIDLRIPDGASVPPLGKVCTTLDDNEWWMWNGQGWQALEAPPPVETILRNTNIGIIPPRELSWENQPVALDGRRYNEGVEVGRIPTKRHPFSADLTNSINSVYLDHLVHEVSGGDQTVTIENDISMQVCVVGPGRTGGRYDPGTTRIGATNYISYGGEGGGGGGVAIKTLHFKRGDTLRMQITSGYTALYINGRLEIRIDDDPPDCSGQGGEGIDRTTGRDPGNNAEAFDAIPAQLGWRTYRSRGNQGRGNRSAGTAGGGGGAGHGLPGNGSALALPWTASPGIGVGGGGAGGTSSAAGERGRGAYGAGGGGGGGAAVGTPALTVSATDSFDDISRAFSIIASSNRANEFRIRYALRQEDNQFDPFASSDTWSNWQSSNTFPITLADNTSVVKCQVQARVGSTQAETAILYFSGLSPSTVTSAPTNLNVVFTWTAARNLLSFDLSATNATGYRHKVRLGSAAEDADWLPQTGFNSRTRYSRTIADGVNTVRVRLQAQNAAGTTEATFDWNRPAVILNAPSTPTISFAYTEASGSLLTSWEATGATSYTFRYITTTRDGGVTTSPWSGASAAQSHSLIVPANVSSIRYQVRGINSAGNGSIGERTRNFGTGTIVVATRPATPVITLGAITRNSIAISWAEGTGRDAATSWQRRISTSGNPGPWQDVTLATVAHTYTSLNTSTEYLLDVRAVNAQGNSAYARVSATTLAAPTDPVATRPGAPNVWVASKTQTRVNINWSPGPGPTPTSYRTRQGTSGAWINKGSDLTHSYTGLVAGTEYVFQVQGNTDGDIATIRATTDEAPVVGPTLQAPTVPSILFNSFTGGRLSASWSSVGANETRFRWTRTDDKDSSSTGAWSSWSSSVLSDVEAMASNIVSARLEVQARNGTSPNFNVVSGSNTWNRPQAAPGPVTIRVSSVRFTPGSGTFGSLNLSAERAESYRYRLGSGAWSPWSSASNYNNVQLISGTDTSIVIRA